MSPEKELILQHQTIARVLNLISDEEKLPLYAMAPLISLSALANCIIPLASFVWQSAGAV